MEAVCVLTNTIDKNIKGNIEFKEVSDYLVVTVNITGLSEGYHGIHIHQYGDLRDNCKSLCNHFNPYNKLHGDIGDSKNNRHVGDLGNIYADAEGTVNIIFIDRLIKLSGKCNIKVEALLFTKKKMTWE